MLNELEMASWSLFLKEHISDNTHAISDFLLASALIIKKNCNSETLYTVFVTFITHNSGKQLSMLNEISQLHYVSHFPVLNEEFAKLSRPFNYDREAVIKDYNYEVDALEEEHLKREVHTTKKEISDEEEDEDEDIVPAYLQQPH